jgi:ribosomal protein L7/L12
MEIEFPSRLSERVKQMALDPDRKIEAIKLYREETNASLKDAKEAVEEFLENTNKF